MRFAVAAACVAVAALVLGAPALGSEQHPTQGELESELVCPTCHVPLDESNSPIAQEMKTFIRAHIAQGWTKSRIESALADQLGDGIYGVPRTRGFDLLAWLLPIGGALLGALAIGGGAWRWSRVRTGAATTGSAPPLDVELERRIDDELARFDG